MVTLGGRSGYFRGAKGLLQEVFFQRSTANDHFYVYTKAVHLRGGAVGKGGEEDKLFSLFQKGSILDVHSKP